MKETTHGVSFEQYPYTMMAVCTCGKWSKLADCGWRDGKKDNTRARKELYAAHSQHYLDAATNPAE